MLYITSECFESKPCIHPESWKLRLTLSVHQLYVLPPELSASLEISFSMNVHIPSILGNGRRCAMTTNPVSFPDFHPTPERLAYYDQQRQSWQVFRYTEVQRVLSDFTIFSSKVISANKEIEAFKNILRMAFLKRIGNWSKLTDLATFRVDIEWSQVWSTLSASFVSFVLE